MKIQDLFEEEWTREKLYEWFKEHNDQDVNEDPPKIENIFIMSGHVVVRECVGMIVNGELPFKFTPKFSHVFYASEMTSFKGFPLWLAGSFNGIYSTKELSFEGFPETVDGDLTFDTPSLKGIHEHLKFARKMIYLTPYVTKNVLGLLLINGVKRFSTLSGSAASSDMYDRKPISQVVDMLNEQLSNSNKHQRVMLAQRKLIENDLDEYAEL